MGQKASKSDKVCNDGILTEAEISKYQRTILKYEIRRNLNEETKTRKRRAKDPRYQYRKPQTVDEVSEQGIKSQFIASNGQKHTLDVLTS